MGLRTDIEQGLSPDEDILEGQVTLEEVWQAFETPRQLTPRTTLPADPRITVDEPPPVTSSQIEEPASNMTLPPTPQLAPKPHSKAQNSQKFRDRRRVYGDNIIPTRPRKSILQLMWLTLQDKTLV
jgi:hypothetical protein